MQNLNDSPSPLSRLINDDNLTILENIIPHCNANLGKFLALCLKISEMQKIMEGFDDSERLSACGFENNAQDIASILRSVRNSVSEEKAHQIDNILQILNFSRFYEKYNQILSEHPELVQIIRTCHISSRYTTLYRAKSILRSFSVLPLKFTYEWLGRQTERKIKTAHDTRTK